MLPLSMIVAIGNNGAIGYKGKDTMAYFLKTCLILKKLPKVIAIIMGRKTWKEIGKPLQGRRNIVLSKQLCIKMWRFFLQLKIAISSARTTDLEPIMYWRI